MKKYGSKLLCGDMEGEPVGFSVGGKIDKGDGLWVLSGCVRFDPAV